MTAGLRWIGDGEFRDAWVLWLLLALEQLGIIVIGLETLNLINQLFLCFFCFFLQLELGVGLRSVIDDLLRGRLLTFLLLHWLVRFHLTDRLFWILLLLVFNLIGVLDDGRGVVRWRWLRREAHISRSWLLRDLLLLRRLTRRHVVASIVIIEQWLLFCLFWRLLHWLTGSSLLLGWLWLVVTVTAILVTIVKQVFLLLCVRHFK